MNDNTSKEPDNNNSQTFGFTYNFSSKHLSWLKQKFGKEKSK